MKPQDPSPSAKTLAAQEETHPMAPAELASKDVVLPVYVIRGQKVMLEADVAQLYEVETTTLVRAVRRHIHHFPVDFMFRLTPEELKELHTISDAASQMPRNRSMPYAFTEAGLAMVSQVLNSARALQVNVAITRDFVRLRRFCGTNAQLAEKLNEIDTKYDAQLKRILAALEALQGQIKPTDKRVGFYVS